MFVSVVIPVFNGAGTVGTAIDSAVAQNFRHEFEIIVVNDGSTDSTAQVLARYATRIRVIKQNNRGAGAARNTGAANSEAEYLAFLDADDFWMPDMLESCVAALQRERDAVLAYCDAVSIDSCARVVAPNLVPPQRRRAPSMTELLTRWWPILPSTVVIRRNVFNQCGGFAEDLRAYEDVHLWLLARERGPFVFVPRPLVHYRIAPLAQRMDRYESYHRRFVERVRARYGRSANSIVRDTHRAYVSAFSHQGLLAMRAGQIREARQCFLRALRHAPLDTRTVLRLARSFLPLKIARRVSRRSNRGR